MGHISGGAANGTFTIAYAYPWSGAWPVGPTIGAAFLVGLNEVKRRNILPGYEMEWFVRDTASNARICKSNCWYVWNGLLEIYTASNARICWSAKTRPLEKQ